MKTKILALSCILLLFNLGTDLSRSVAQSSSKIVFPWWDGDLYTMNIDGSNVARLATETVAVRAIWSPSGNQIVYQRSDGNDFEIYTIDSSGTNKRRLTDNTAMDTDPAWSSDGSKLTFTSDRNGNPEIYVMNSDGSNSVNITNHSSFDEYPAWSPDGSKIAFASGRDGGKYEIYIMNADGSNPVRRTNYAGLDQLPRWSPDGTKIAFLRTEVDRYCPRIYVMNSDGTGVVALTSEICELTQITWLSGSNQVVYLKGFDLWQVNTDGSGATKLSSFPSTGMVIVHFDLTTTQAPPGGGGPGGTGLFGQYFDNADLTGFKFNRVDSTVNFSWGSGSPDPSLGADTFSVRWTGQVIPQYSETYTFYTQSDDGVRLWVNGQQLINNWTNHTSTEDNATIALTANFRYMIKLEYYDNTFSAVARLSWSSPSQPKQVIPQERLFPNGPLVFQSTRDGNEEIYLMNPDGTSEARRTTNTASDTHPSAVPGRTQMVFTSTRTGNSEIFSSGIDGSNPVNLTNNSAFDAYPSLYHDGRVVFASTRNGGNFNLWLRSADGSTVTQLTSSSGAERYSSWSPDGQWIVYDVEDNGVTDLWKIPAAGGTPVRLTQNAGSNFEPDWSPNGAKIAFRTTRGGNAELFTMNPDGSGQVAFVTNGPRGFAPAWSPDSVRVAYHSWASGTAQIYSIAAGGTPLQMTSNTSDDKNPAWGAQ